MSPFKLIIKSLTFFKRQYLALLVGTMISTTVLTGALIVGDSVNYSLKRLVGMRLGPTKYALETGDRFVSGTLSGRLAEQTGFPVISLLKLNGLLVNPESGERVNKIELYGIEENFWNYFKLDSIELNEDEIVISQNIASKLNLKPGMEVVLRAENASVIPLDAPFSEDKDNTVVFRMVIRDILDDEHMGRFSLKTIQRAPYNVFMPSEILEEKLNLENRKNILLVSGDEKNNPEHDDLDNALGQTWKIEDASLGILNNVESGKFEIVSDRIFIDHNIAGKLNVQFPQSESILTYLVNSIRKGPLSTPYSFVTAASEPYVPAGLSENEIIVNEWLAEDLNLKAGDTVWLDYYIVGPMRSLKEVGNPFIVSRIIPVESNDINSSLMPEYPGLSGTESCRDWESGLPIDMDRIRDKDEVYWVRYRGTPKALIAFQKGKELWQNDFGYLTALRLDKTEFTQEEIRSEIRSALHPKDVGFVFKPVYDEGIRAANNSVDFGGLFLSLSFFVLAAAIVLTYLLYGFFAESRMQETGILSSLGFTRRRILVIRFSEAFFVALLGGLAGALLGVLYNFGLTSALNTIWQDALKTNMLVVHVQLSTIIIGTAGGLGLALLTVVAISYKGLKLPITHLLEGSYTYSVKQKARNKGLTLALVILGLAGTLILVLYGLIESVDENAGIFLTAGALFIVGYIALCRLFLIGSDKDKRYQIPGLIELSAKNTRRNRKRSLITVLLLTLGVFTIIITGANRKTFYGAYNQRNSGTGGFLFWVETAIPVNLDIDTRTGRSEFGLSDEIPDSEDLFVQFNTLDGDDASCLNLNQVQNPRILGVTPEELNDRHSFSFKKLLDKVDASEPWLALNNHYPDNVIPAIADQTVITWGLMKKVGDTLHYLNEQGDSIKLLLVGGLNNSIFQGNVLISKKMFRKHFPSVNGSKIMLVDTPQKNSEDLESILQARFTDFGIDIEKTTTRLAEFNSVTNTYLTVFMILGGLGVILGTFGLGIVLLRNMMERKSELALLLSVGYKKSEVLRMVFMENLFLLIAGIAGGVLAALFGIFPTVLSPSFSFQGNFSIILIPIVFLSGLLWIWIPSRQTVRKDLIPALRNE